MTDFGYQGDLQVIDLHMTTNGFEQASKDLMRLDSKKPQVYIHVGAEGAFDNQILRVGKGADGAYKRWMRDTNGHKNTFLWAIGESKKYKNSAQRYPNYLLFFASLAGLKTKLYLLTYKDIGDAENQESALTKHYDPIWEQLKRLPKSNSNYPYLTTQKRNEEVAALASGFGGALEIIEQQRSGRSPFSHPIQDLVKMEMRSLRSWG